MKGAAVSEEQAQPLTGKAKRLANLRPYVKGEGPRPVRRAPAWARMKSTKSCAATTLK